MFPCALRGSPRLRAAMSAAFALVLPLAAGAAQSSRPPSKATVAAIVDSMARAYMAEKGPASMSIAITRGTDTLVLRAWGMADIAAKRAATPATIYKIGSVSKQFTAVLLLKQVERGRLALTDSIGRHLTAGLRPEWRTLTIEQLLNHTAGLPNDLQREGRPEEEVSSQTMIAWAARDTMRFAPGTRFAYSNVGYLLLGALVEKLYGRPYREAVRDEIARPLGLRSLGWCTAPAKDNTVATGYQYLGPGHLEPSAYAHPSKSLGSGGLCSSAGDLAAWNQALHGGRVLTPASYAAMTTPRGAARGYGFGLQFSVRPAPWNARLMYHLGGIIGFSAQNAWFPAESLSVTILFNSIGDGFPTSFALDVARAISAPGSPAKADSVASANLARPAGSGAPVSPAAALAARVDSVVKADLLSRGVPSVSVAVVRGDKTLVQKAWGRADIASGRTADPTLLYSLGSGAKQFTAVMVLKLVERGRLRLGDSIGRHLSGLPSEWEAITIEQLLNHTSGLPRGGFVDMSRIEENVSFDTKLARAARNPMESQPGTTHSYSNLGYVVLGALVERMYGKPYAVVLHDEITRPLGLTALRYCADAEPGTLAAGHMLSLSDGELSRSPAVHPSQQLGAAGICSTAADLATWNRALHGGRVLSEASYRAMITPRGVAGNYGFGLSVGRVAWGDSIIAHGGQEPGGYVSENAWFPADSLSVTILYNSFPRLAGVNTHALAAVALGRTPPAAPAALNATPNSTPNATPQAASRATPATGIVGEEVRRQFVGEYEMRPGAPVFKVDFEGGTFVLTPPRGDKMPLVHKSGATYGLGDGDATTTVTFLVDAEGRVVGIVAKDQNSPERRLRKIR